MAGFVLMFEVVSEGDGLVFYVVTEGDGLVFEVVSDDGVCIGV